MPRFNHLLLFCSPFLLALLSPAQGMMDAPCDEHGDTPVSHYPVANPSSASSTPRFPDSESVEIDYNQLPQHPSKKEAFKRMLDAHIPDKTRVSLKNAILDLESISHLSYLLNNRTQSVTQLALDRCALKDYAAFVAWGALRSNGLTISVVIGKPVGNCASMPMAYNLETPLADGHKVLVDALDTLRCPVAKSSVYREVTIQAAKTEAKIQKITDGTERITIQNVNFTPERAAMLFHYIQNARPLMPSSAPTSVLEVTFQGCGLENYAALNAFESLRSQWAALRLTVGFLPALIPPVHASQGPAAAMPSAPVLPGSRPDPQALNRFFTSLNGDN